MTDMTQLADRYIAMWNEADGERRRALVARLWTDGATYVDPHMRAAGHAEIDGMVAAVQARFPGHRFRRLGPVDAHNDRIRFAWALAAGDDAPPLARGVDFGVVADGRLAAITGFLDEVTAAAQAA